LEYNVNVNRTYSEWCQLHNFAMRCPALIPIKIDEKAKQKMDLFDGALCNNPDCMKKAARYNSTTSVIIVETSFILLSLDVLRWWTKMVR